MNHRMQSVICGMLCWGAPLLAEEFNQQWANKLNLAIQQVASHMEYVEHPELLAMASEIPQAALAHKTALSHHETDPFYHLSLEDWEKDEIHKLLTTLADSNLIKLALRKRSLEKLGKQINHVHPMRFISHAFSNSHLRYCMHQIRKSSFKWDGFIDGFSKRMKEEADRGNLTPYAAGFSHYLNVNVEQVRSYLEDRDFEGLVRFLLKH